jgi:PIN domain nuclease of toxin-antitoxin system
MVILDTCALIELCAKAPRLSKATLTEIDREAHVLAVSFAEIALKVKAGKLVLGRSPRELAAELNSISSVSIVPTTLENWFAAVELRWSHRDPADRLIVAYAQSVGGAIVTSDRQIRKFYKRWLWR